MFRHVKSPFKYKDIYNELQKDMQCVIKKNGDNINDIEIQNYLDTLYKWICSTPKITTYRVNTLKTTNEDVANHIKNILSQCKRQIPSVSIFSTFPELVIVERWNDLVNLSLEVRSNEVVVDAACGLAVLRGSHIFAPGVMGLPQGLTAGDKVSIFADITGHCKKGLIKKYEDSDKIFIGNGVLKQTRDDIFCSNGNARGIAIHVTDVVSRLPQLGNESVPEEWALLQNLPSIICSKVLDPKPGDTVLDMCAAPGNKTTHISVLMNGEGTLIALDKCKSKLKSMAENCKKFSAGNVKIFCYDSTKAVCDSQTQCIEDGPPFKKASFDRILLDGPCSGLGQRPQLFNPITAKQLRSYSPLQRKLFATAVELLKPGGTLVYSTCTITVAENEAIVSWALRTYPFLELKSVKNQLELLIPGMNFPPGHTINGVEKEESAKVCRFGLDTDSIGFFIACFVKKN